MMKPFEFKTHPVNWVTIAAEQRINQHDLMDRGKYIRSKAESTNIRMIADKIREFTQTLEHEEYPNTKICTHVMIAVEPENHDRAERFKLEEDLDQLRIIRQGIKDKARPDLLTRDAINHDRGVIDAGSVVDDAMWKIETKLEAINKKLSEGFERGSPDKLFDYFHDNNTN